MQTGILCWLAALLVALPLPVHACEGKAFELLENLSGKWEVYRDDRLMGRMQVEPGAKGCVLLERWRALDGTEAIAMHWSEPVDDEDDDVESHALKQVYVDNTGWIMKADGAVENQALVYEGAATIQGEDVVLRAILHGLGTDEIVHIGDVSRDGGKTWRRMSTMKYRRAE